MIAQLAEMERLGTQSADRQYGSFLMHWLDEYDVGLAEPTTGPRRTWTIPIGKPSTFPAALRNWAWPTCPAFAGFARKSPCPNPLPAGKATIYLGSIEKMDTTYINGQWVGASSWVENPRAYDVQEGILKPGTTSWPSACSR